MSRLLTESEAAERLNVTVGALQAWRIRGQGPPYLKLGRLVRYSPEHLEAFVAECERFQTQAEVASDEQ